MYIIPERPFSLKRIPDKIRVTGATSDAILSYLMGQPPGTAIRSSIRFTMPFDCAQDRPFNNGDLGVRQAVKGVNHVVNPVFLGFPQSKHVIPYYPYIYTKALKRLS